jgi:heme/copper-type cytochrome/quinol oxidase subunit 3
MTHAPDPPASSASPLHKHHEDHPDNISKNMRIGMVLFLIYTAFFGGFIYMHVAHPAAMASTMLPLPGERELPLFGTNLGVVYGMCLILAAFVLALVYMSLTRTPRER